jgi:hypothetical protein
MHYLLRPISGHVWRLTYRNGRPITSYKGRDLAIYGRYDYASPTEARNHLAQFGLVVTAWQDPDNAYRVYRQPTPYRPFNSQSNDQCLISLAVKSAACVS